MADEEDESIFSKKQCFKSLKNKFEKTQLGSGEPITPETVLEFEGLKIWAKELNNRLNIPADCFYYVKNCCECCLGVMNDGTCKVGLQETSLLVATEAFRFLRNTCAGVTVNQNKIIEIGLLNSIMSIITKISTNNDKSILKSEEILVKSGLQLLGNLVTGNPASQDEVWTQCFPQFFLQMMHYHDLATRDLMCMVIHNCSRTLEKRTYLTRTKDGLQLVSLILELCANHSELEWGYFVVESMVCSGQLADMFIGLSNDIFSQTILLDLITARLEEFSSVNDSSHTEEWLSEVSAIVLVDEFLKQADCILLYDRMSQEDPCNVLLVMRLLKLLCTASGHHKKYNKLQNKSSLLEKTLELLKRTSDADKISQFSNLKAAPSSADSGELNPTHGFKRDLIRLIANLCHKHLNNQNKVREMGGIPVILNHTNIDDFNPYICQWAVLAMRNILEENQANQEEVASLGRQGLADNSRLQQFGVNVSETRDGNIRVASAKMPED